MKRSREYDNDSFQQVEKKVVCKQSIVPEDTEMKTKHINGFFKSFQVIKLVVMDYFIDSKTINFQIILKIFRVCSFVVNG